MQRAPSQRQPPAGPGVVIRELANLRTLGRLISVQFRKMDSAKDCRRVLKRFNEWKTLQLQLAPPQRRERKELLIVRLDDIGDYLLFRNHLRLYKQSPRWQEHRVTLLANDSWRPLFERLDADAVDAVIWVNKQRYLQDLSYAFSVWQQLRGMGVDTVVAPSRTRPLLLDDLCMLAAAPRCSIGCANTHVHASWNQLSNGLYGPVFTSSDESLHESTFNKEFAEWVCGISATHAIPSIDASLDRPIAERYWICFVGASIRSKRWPTERWIEFIREARRIHPIRIFLAGQGPAELKMVHMIQKRTGAESIAGTVTLPGLLDWVSGAQAVVTNDTVAAHMGVALRRPTVIVSNGVNYLRFSEYRSTGAKHVAAVYPEVLMRRRARLGDGLYEYSDAITADIASISASRVLEELRTLLVREISDDETPMLKHPEGATACGSPLGVSSFPRCDEPIGP
jgi:ADP-heptose:LPS heptosyltransferase